MKRIYMIGIVFFLLTMLVGCRQQAEIPLATPVYSAAFDELVFSSLEEFLAGHLIASEGRAGRDITELVARYQTPFFDTELREVVENINFTSLETLYLPIGIPDGFQLHVIRVNEEFVNVRFLHEDDMTSEATIQDAIVQERDFRLNFTRWDLDSPMDGVFEQLRATPEDLIAGSYLFVAPNMFIWSSDREILYMYVPLSWFSDQRATTDIADMMGFAEISTVNLTDSAEVLALIEATMDDSRGGDRIWELIEAATDYRREDVR